MLHVDPTTLSATEKPSLVPTATFSRPTTAVEFKGQDSVMTLSLEAIVGKASIAAVAVGFGVIIVVIISLFTCKRQRYTSGHYSPSGEARQTQCDTAIINDHVGKLMLSLLIC